MKYKGMVVLENEDFSDAMQIVHCIKKKIEKLTEILSEVEVDDYEDEDETNTKSHANERSGRYRY